MTGFALVIIRTQCWGLFKRLYLPEKYLNKSDFILSIIYLNLKLFSLLQVPCLRLPLSVCIQKLYVMPVSQRHAHSPFISYQISIHFQPFSVGGDHGISLIGSGLASESQHHEGRRVEPTPLWLPAEPHKFLSVTATRKQISFFHSGNFCDNGNPCSTVFFFSSVIPSMVASNLKGKKPVLNAQ